MKKKLTVILTVVGILGTTAAVGAEDLVEKVTGYLQKDVKIVVNGKDSALTPVYIDGKAYLPVRDAATQLGYTVNYDEANKEIELDEAEEAELMRATGVVVSVQTKDDGSARIELLGSTWVILNVDKSTVIKSLDGKTLSAADLKAGTQIDAGFGPAMAMSYPGQAHAVNINVHADRAVKEDTIKEVKQTDDGWQVHLDNLVLNGGKETRVLTSQGESVKWEDLKAGTKVKAYYGPYETKSLPPQSPVFLLVVQAQSTIGTPKMSPESAQEYRNLAWAQVKEQASHITTKQDEATVQIVSANEVGVMASTDEQKKLLADAKAANGNVITVTYNTDQDELLGPLTAVFDFNTKAFIGFNIRK